MSTLKKLQAAADKAQAALVAAINEQFPVGTQILAPWGRGWIHGVVAFPSRDEQVPFRTESGRVHRQHWRYVQKKGR